METINAIIVENEKQKSDYLEKMLATYYQNIHVLASCATTNEAVEKILSLKPHLVFLDVRLEKKESGFEILELTRTVPYDVIFTTGYDEYALRAFKFSAIDYILKPFGKLELQAAMDEYFSRTNSITARSREALIYNYNQQNKAMHKVGIHVSDGIDFITVSEIIYCQASKNYTLLYLVGNKKITSSQNLGLIEELLSGHVFIRTHNSYLVNLNHIKKHKNHGEGGILMLTENKEAELAKRRKDEFFKMLAYLKIILPKSN